jgi:hypothetical protein
MTSPGAAAKCVGTWGYSKEYLNSSNQTRKFPTWQQQQQQQQQKQQQKQQQLNLKTCPHPPH